MPETELDEQQTEQQTAPEETTAETPAETPAEAPQEAPENGPEEAPQKTKRPSILLPVLTILLIVVGIGEAIFWGYFGFSAYARSLARERYEQQQKALAEEQAANGVKGGSSYSPNLKVENGTVTWERENWGYAESSQPTNTSTILRREDGLRLARLPVFIIPYLLAKPEEKSPVPQAEQTAPPVQTEQTTPATA